MASNVASPKFLPSIHNGFPVTGNRAPLRRGHGARLASRHDQLGNGDGPHPLGQHDPSTASERPVSWERVR